MRKSALWLSLCGGCATLIAALLAATHANAYHIALLAVGAELLLGLACAAAVALSTRKPTLAAVLQLVLALLFASLTPTMQPPRPVPATTLFIAVAWGSATALFIASAVVVFFSVPHRGWSLFGIARVVGTLLAGFFLLMGISELAAGLGGSGHFFADLISFWPMLPLVIGPLLGWLGTRWAGVGGVLLLGEYAYWVGLALWGGYPGGAGGWGGTLLFIGLWALVGVVYLREWWRHRPHGESHRGVGTTRAAAH